MSAKPKAVESRYGRLAVVGPARGGWNCLCDCGKTVIVAGYKLRYGTNRSCGCLAADTLRARSVTHGKSKTRAWQIWSKMRGRCENPRDGAYERYGGRGIKVCDRWQAFERFLEDMGQPPTGMSIDRIDNSGDYDPGNCRWATATEQTRNRSVAIRLTINGTTKSLIEWCDEFGTKYSNAHSRLRRGWSPERAVTP